MATEISAWPAELGACGAQAIALARQSRDLLVPVPGVGRVVTRAAQVGGSQIPLVLLHGFDSSLLEWRSQVALLSARHEVWTLDLFGFGFTERPRAADYSPAAIARHLFAFWQTQIGRPAVFVGASMGGGAALDLALAHPEAVAGLVLVNSVGFAGGFGLGPLLVGPLGEVFVEFWRQRKVQTQFWGELSGLLDGWAREAVRCATLHLHQPRWAEALGEFTRSGGYTHLAPRLAALRQPTVILWGDRDPLLDASNALRFVETIPGSRLRWIAGAGHAPHVEQPEPVAAAIDQFATCLAKSSDRSPQRS